MNPMTPQATDSSPPSTTPPLTNSPPHQSVRTYPKAWALLLTTSGVGVAIDLVTKWAAFEFVGDAPVRVSRAAVLAARTPGDTLPYPVPTREIIPGLLDFTLVLNPGAVFGIGAGKRFMFIGFTAFALCFALFLFLKWTLRRDHLSHAAVGLLIAGGLGNLYDRLMFACVRDFIHPLPGLRLPGGWEWPWGGRDVWPYVSNVADLFLILGIGALIWRTLRPIHPLTHATPPAPKPSP